MRYIISATLNEPKKGKRGQGQKQKDRPSARRGRSSVHSYNLSGWGTTRQIAWRERYTSARPEAEDNLAHFDSVAVAQHNMGTFFHEREAIYNHRIGA